LSTWDTAQLDYSRTGRAQFSWVTKPGIFCCIFVDSNLEKSRDLNSKMCLTHASSKSYQVLPSINAKNIRGGFCTYKYSSWLKYLSWRTWNWFRIAISLQRGATILYSAALINIPHLKTENLIFLLLYGISIIVMEEVTRVCIDFTLLIFNDHHTKRRARRVSSKFTFLNIIIILVSNTKSKHK
jgi:hypothetical protein